MATPTGSIYGLLQPKQKGALSLQTLGGTPLEDDEVDENGLPKSPFANLPLTPITGSGTTPGAIQQVQAANIPANFQFTGEFDALNRALLQQETDAGFQRKNTLASIAEQYLESVRRAEKQQEQSRKGLFASLADRGALGSGAALQSVADFDTEFNDYLNQLSRQRASGIASTENEYASLLNQLGRQREGLVSRQQQFEEERRLEEERLRAEAQRQAQLEEQRRQQIQQLIDSQNQARIAAEQAAAAARQAQFSYQPPQFGGGYNAGGYSPAPQAPAAAPPTPQYKPGEQRITLPAGANGMSWSAFGHWVRGNIDKYASDQAVRAVYNELLRTTPQGGTPISDIAWLIQQHPNPGISQINPYNAGNGVRVF